MTSHVFLFIVALFSTKGFIDTTENSNYRSSDFPLLCSLSDESRKCSDILRSYVGGERHVIPHSLFKIGIDHDARTLSRRKLASNVLHHLSLHNRRKLERHASALRRVLYPVLNNLPENKGNYEIQSTRIMRPVNQEYALDLVKSDEYYSVNSLTTVKPNKASDTDNIVTTKSGHRESDMHGTKYPELTTSRMELAETFTTQKPHTEEYGKPFYSFRSSKEITMSLPKQFTEEKKYINSIYLQALNEFERTFYIKTFEKLSLRSPTDRQENGISFVQSGLFLNLLLLGFSTVTDTETAQEINSCIGVNITKTEVPKLISEVLSVMPNSSDNLKWRWSYRLVLGSSQDVSEEFRYGPATALRLNLDKLNGTESPEELAAILNHMVEKDSGGTIRDVFEVDEMSEGVRAIVVTTLYLRARWRSAPTVLNGTRPFHDAINIPSRTVRMIRINDIMRYGNFTHWKCHAIEIPYSTPGLSLLMLVPYEKPLKNLVQELASASLEEIVSRMDTKRIAVSMPIYTLRMTLLLPSKLQAMGVNRLFNWNNIDTGQLRLSHAVQRLMFWAEAGRNAFKDDGIEWDEAPEMELMVDGPYIFFVRWNNFTLLNGNFVL